MMRLAVPKPGAPWICLVGLLVLYLIYLAWMRPARNFGSYHDDSVYFSSAKALAEGRGYIIPSFPGTPRQTKYPVLYPWLLSWIWKWNPSFPANVAPALWVTALFGCCSLIAAFQLLRKLEGVGDWPALVIVGLYAFQPQFLFLSGALLSDIPFVALGLTAAVIGDSAMRQGGGTLPAVATGILAGLATLMRLFGVAVLAGIFAAAICRRAHRQAIVFCLVAVLLLGAVLWLGGFHLVPPQAENKEATPEPAWRQTVVYYTDYWGVWKAAVPSLEAFLGLLKINLALFLVGPISYLLSPLVRATSLPALAVYLILTVGILAGIVRQACSQEWKSIHFIFVPYSAILLLWDYPQMPRYLLLFLPLFYAGLFVEARRVVLLLAKSLRSGRPAAERVLGGALTVAIILLAGAGAWNYLDGERQRLPASAAQRAAIAQEKMEAYRWIRENTDPNTRIVAYEDVSLYLHTGRQAVRPIAFSLRWVYANDERILEEDLAHITDVARHVGAKYWLTADDDFSLEAGLPRIKQRMGQLKSVLPTVFHSQANAVQIYELCCLLHPLQAECKSCRSGPLSSPREQPQSKGKPQVGARLVDWQAGSRPEAKTNE